MGMVDRGAQLDWLSQYPEEKEILLPPLTGMEVQADEVTPDDVRQLTMRLNINLRSRTLEQLEAARQKDLGELVSMADKVGRGARHSQRVPQLRLQSGHCPPSPWTEPVSVHGTQPALRRPQDLRVRPAEGDVPRRLAAVGRLAREIAAADRAAFNENGRFVEATEAVLGQVGPALASPAPGRLCLLHPRWEPRPTVNTPPFRRINAMNE